MLDIGGQTEHWNKVWKDRIHANRVEMNMDKYYFMMKSMVSRPYLAPMEKLDIGCGTGVHAAKLASFNPLWGLKWTGVDLSADAVAIARKYGMNAILADIYEFTGVGKKYKVFLFFDSLEHFFDHERLGKKIVELADKDHIVIGNVPMYSSEHGDGCERMVSTLDLFKFLVWAGCTERPPAVHIYGVRGFPYMFFEASNKDYSKWAD